jgi:hypothetical protein
MFAVTQMALLVVIEMCVVAGLAMAAVRWHRHQRQLRADIDLHRDVVDHEATIAAHALERESVTRDISHDDEYEGIVHRGEHVAHSHFTKCASFKTW